MKKRRLGNNKYCKWFIVTVCITFAIVSVGYISSSESRKNSELFKDAIEMINGNEEIELVLGSPIKVGYIVKGHLSFNIKSVSNISFRVEGKLNRRGTISVEAIRVNDGWRISRCVFDSSDMEYQIEVLRDLCICHFYDSFDQLVAAGLFEIPNSNAVNTGYYTLENNLSDSKEWPNWTFKGLKRIGVEPESRVIWIDDDHVTMELMPKYVHSDSLEMSGAKTDNGIEGGWTYSAHQEPISKGTFICYWRLWSNYTGN